VILDSSKCAKEKQISIITVSIKQSSFFCANVTGILPRNFFSFIDKFEKYPQARSTMIERIIKAKFRAKPVCGQWNLASSCRRIPAFKSQPALKSFGVTI